MHAKDRTFQRFPVRSTEGPRKASHGDSNAYSTFHRMNISVSKIKGQKKIVVKGSSLMKCKLFEGH